MMRPTLAAALGFLLLAACGGPPAAAPTAGPEQPTLIPSVTPTSTPIIPPLPTTVPSPTATPEPAAQSGMMLDAHGIEMVLIPEGEFLMGTDDGMPDEGPMRSVYLDAFYIDLTETTNRQYRDCVEAGVCDPPDFIDCCASPGMGYDSLYPDYFINPAYDDYPVTWLSWDHAFIYCAWRGARLPTEAEWEKAARGTDGRIYPWGNEHPTPEHANYTWWEGEFPQRPLFNTAQVGSYPLGASPYGVLDMAGSLYEWVQERYDPTYYANAPYANPQGPPEGEGSWQIARGGSFWNKADRIRIPNRNHAYLPPDVGHFDAGVRCALDVPSQ